MAMKQSFDRFVVLDFETTGLKRGYKPVEIAWLEFDSDFAVIERVDLGSAFQCAARFIDRRLRLWPYKF